MVTVSVVAAFEGSVTSILVAPPLRYGNPPRLDWEAHLRLSAELVHDTEDSGVVANLIVVCAMSSSVDVVPSPEIPAVAYNRTVGRHKSHTERNFSGGSPSISAAVASVIIGGADICSHR